MSWNNGMRSMSFYILILIADLMGRETVWKSFLHKIY